MHVEVLCWCGRTGRLNARVSAGTIGRHGDTVVVADTDTGAAATVRYQVLCRRHYRTGELGSSARNDPQLPLVADS